MKDKDIKNKLKELEEKIEIIERILKFFYGNGYVDTAKVKAKSRMEKEVEVKVMSTDLEGKKTEETVKAEVKEPEEKVDEKKRSGKTTSDSLFKSK